MDTADVNVSIRQYQEWRSQKCGPAIIAMEIGVVRRILKRARLWQALADEVTIPKQPDTIGYALTPSEKASLLETAALRPEWETACCAAQIALNTTMRGCEIKGLQWRDVDLLAETVSIRRSKTDAGVRVIPLTPEAFEVFVQLRKRAELFGAVEPSHYVFAAFKFEQTFENKKLTGSRITGFDPTRPIGSWKKAWGKLTAKAGLPGLRFHDLRHTAITQLLSNPRVSIQTTKAIAGHVSQRMIDRYSHIHLETKRNAVLDGLAGRGQVINQDIKAAQEQPLSSQVNDFIGRRVGI